MGFNVSSSFKFQAQSKTPDVIRKFTVAGIDYTDKVIQWPTFSRTWNEIRPKTLQLKLANEDQTFNVFRNDKTLMEGQSLVEFGFPGELIVLFSGKIRGIKYEGEDCTMTIVDKFQQLSERQVGTSDVSIDYVNSNYLPSDIAWFTVTSFGGYSNVQSISNPDIDYADFQEWASVFSGDNVFMNGQFDGQKCTEVLRKIGRQTHSAIFIKEDKLSFSRFGLINPLVTSLDQQQILDLKLSFNTNDIVNRQFIAGDFSVTSDTHGFTVLDESTSSINSFGPKDNLIQDNNLWYVDSGSAINLAQRLILANAEPDDSLTVTTGLAGLTAIIGETVFISDVFHTISDTYRILGHTINTDKGLVTLLGDKTQIINGFRLDVSTLDNTDEVLT